MKHYGIDPVRTETYPAELDGSVLACTLEPALEAVPPPAAKSDQAVGEIDPDERVPTSPQPTSGEPGLVDSDQDIDPDDIPY
jgi:hypothetical protein